MLEELRDKAVELRRQLAGIEAAIHALEAGYDQEPLAYPEALIRIEAATKALKENDDDDAAGS
jgi:hypothetical protein